MKKILLLLLGYLLLPLVTFSIIAQVSVTGMVKNAEDDSPLPGVNILIKGTSLGTVTDIDGNYNLNVPDENSGGNLTFSYVGFLSEEIAINGQAQIDVILIPDMQKLDEVVVIGYGVQKRSDLTGAVASVNVEEMQKLPVNSVDVALQGQTAGVLVSQNTGAPGAGVTVRVRGISTLSAIDNVNQSKPMWIVDGVPASVNSVNASDIESIEILKDAAASAIYGANGAAGVVLITTKKGKAGKTQASINYYHGVQTVPNRLDLANASDFGLMFTEIEALRGFDEFSFPNYQNITSYDYQDMIYRDALMDNLDFNVSGGNENTNVYMGIGYLNQEGILKASEFNRFNFRLNTSYKVNKWLTVGENFSFNHEKTDGWEEWQYSNEYESPIMNALSVHPYLPPYYSEYDQEIKDGVESPSYLPPYDPDITWVPKTIGNAESPLPTIELLNKAFTENEGNGMVFAKIEPVKGLSIESRLSGSLNFKDNYDFEPTYWFGPGIGQNNTTSRITRGAEKYFSYNWQNIISYNTSLIDIFNIGAMLGYEVGVSNGEKLEAMRQHLVTEEEEMWYFNASTDDTTASQIVRTTGTGNKTTNYAYFGRINLDAYGKYLLQFNARMDYSSKFGPNKRSGFFPSVSVGWKFSEESFLKNTQNILSFGKIRIGIGKAGINTIPDYAYYPTAAYQSTFSYPMTNDPNAYSGGAPNVLADESIRWEEVVTKNIGLDLAFLSNRLSATFDLFQRNNVGMLVFQSIPAHAGWTVRDISQEGDNIDSRPIVNIGNILNEGFEATVGWKSSVGALKYSFDINYSYAKSIAEDIGVDSFRVGGTTKGLTGNICRTETGGDVGNFYGFQVEKIFQLADTGRLPNGRLGIINQPFFVSEGGDTTYAQQRAAPGDFQFKDTNGDGRLNQEDKVVIGNPLPKHLLGFTLNLEYKIFDLSMFWQGTFGNDIFNATKFYGFNNDGQYNWGKEFVNDHYRAEELIAEDAEGNIVATYPANTDAEYPRLDPTNTNNNFGVVSDFYIEDGSYLRLKNIQLGISLPASVVNRLSLEQFRVYVGARNLLTFTNYSGMDPEVPQDDPLVAGIDKAAYPQARTYIVGVNVKF